MAILLAPGSTAAEERDADAVAPAARRALDAVAVAVCVSPAATRGARAVCSADNGGRGVGCKETRAILGVCSRIGSCCGTQGAWHGRPARNRPRG